MDVATIFGGVASFLWVFLWDDEPDPNTKIIRWIAGILAVIILVIIIQRRRTRVK
jgi:hypothetical protein